MEIIFDSSTLILLAKIEILRDIAEEIKIIIPERVKAECIVKESIDARLISTLIKEKKIFVEATENLQAVKKIRHDFRIEAGEADALWLARKLNCPLAVDDGPTIKACKVFGQSFATAIHFLLDLVSKRKLDHHTAMAKLEKLSVYGRYSKQIIKDAVLYIKGGNK